MCKEGSCPLRPILSGVQNSPEELQVRRAEGCHRPAESLLPTGFPRQQPSLISVPPWKHGLREALATNLGPLLLRDAAVAGHVASVPSMAGL